jgi:hypothetical protein
MSTCKYNLFSHARSSQKLIYHRVAQGFTNILFHARSLRSLKSAKNLYIDCLKPQTNEPFFSFSALRRTLFAQGGEPVEPRALRETNLYLPRIAALAFGISSA